MLAAPAVCHLTVIVGAAADSAGSGVEIGIDGVAAAAGVWLGVGCDVGGDAGWKYGAAVVVRGYEIGRAFGRKRLPTALRRAQ